MEEPDRLLNIVRPILDADENSDKREEAKDFSNLMKSLENLWNSVSGDRKTNKIFSIFSCGS